MKYVWIIEGYLGHYYGTFRTRDAARKYRDQQLPKYYLYFITKEKVRG